MGISFPRSSARRGARALLAVLTVGTGVVAATATPAGAATINVPCGDVAALRAAIITANVDTAPDTIVLGSSCVYTIVDAAAPASLATGLPAVTQPLTIDGNGSTIQRAANAPAFRLVLAFGAPLELRRVTLQGGSVAPANGGAIAGINSDVVLDQATVWFNVAQQGGAIALAGGTLTVRSSTIAANQALIGGGILTAGSTAVTIDRSTIWANRAFQTIGAAWVQGGTTTISNSTLAGNTGLAGYGGVTVSNSGATSGVANVTASTFTDSTATTNPASTAPASALATFIQAGGGTATINVDDTIIADTDSVAANVAPSCWTPAGGTINDLGGNLEWPNDTCGFDTVANPLLGALAANGGTTASHALLPGSPAIDLGGNDCPTIDQRGHARPDGDACDAGAYEADLPETAAEGPDGPTAAPMVTFTSDAAGATFECQLDGGDWDPCTTPHAPEDITDGDHVMAVRAIAGGYSDPSPAEVAFTVDTVVPDTTITAGPAATIYQSSASFQFESDTEGVTFECRLDGGTFEPCTSPHPESGFAPGGHEFQVRAVGPVNIDPTPASHTFTYQRCTLIRLTLLGITICL